MTYPDGERPLSEEEKTELGAILLGVVLLLLFMLAAYIAGLLLNEVGEFYKSLLDTAWNWMFS